MAEINAQNISSYDADIDPASHIDDDASKYHIKWPFNENGTLSNTLLKALEDRDELTIALMGRTESGKTLFKYSLLYYLAYPTFKDAYNSNKLPQLAEAISSLDKTFHPQIGEAKTQYPKTHIFRLPNGKRLRMVDFPGMGKGKEIDQQRLQNILNHLAKLGTIHMMCFVFNINEPRATEEFRNILEELVKYFNKDITKHFTFCFTYGLTLDWDTTRAKNSVQSEFDKWSHKNDVHIQLTDENCFCVDSKPSEVLMDKSKATNFDDNEERWDYSGEGLKALMLCASALGTYSMEHIRSIPKAKDLLTQLTTVIKTVMERPTEELLTYIMDWMHRIGIKCVDLYRSNKIYCILGLIGVVLLTFWKYYGEAKIGTSLRDIIEIAARMQAFILENGIRIAHGDIFLQSLEKLKEWLNKNHHDLELALDDCRQSLSVFFGSLINLYTKTLEEARKTEQTPQDIDELHKKLCEVPYFGQPIRDAMTNRSKTGQAEGNDDEIIQLVFEEH